MQSVDSIKISDIDATGTGRELQHMESSRAYALSAAMKKPFSTSVHSESTWCAW
jgi:hypothetical protein